MWERILGAAAAHPRRYLTYITGIMVVVTAARYAQSPPRLTDDQTSNWWPVVNDLLDGRGFTECLPEYFPFCTQESPTAMREPIPLLIHAGMAAISGRSLWMSSLLQAALNVLVAWLLFALGRRCANDRVGLIAAGIWALYLPAYQDVLNIAGDQMATVTLLSATLVLFNRTKHTQEPAALIIGVLFGMAALCRSAAIAFAVIAGVAVVAAGRERMLRRRVWAGVLFALGVGLALAPWAVRNYHVFGRPLLGSSLSGYNLFRHNAPLTSDGYCHFVAAEEGQHHLDSLITAHPELTGRENEAEMNLLYATAGKEIIARHPGRYALLSLYRALPLWTNFGVNEAYGKPSGLLDRLIMVMQVVLLVLAILGVLKGRASGRSLMALAVALYCLMHMAVVARLRFLLPAMPFVVLLAATALARSGNAGNEEAPR